MKSMIVVLTVVNGLAATAIGFMVDQGQFGIAAAIASLWIFQGIDSLWALILKRT
jgi:hypothetical protein